MNQHINLGKLRAAGKQLIPPRSPGGILTVRFSSDLREAVENLPNFTPVTKYAIDSRFPALPGEMGRLEIFRFFEYALLPPESWQIEEEKI